MSVDEISAIAEDINEQWKEQQRFEKDWGATPKGESKQSATPPGNPPEGDKEEGAEQDPLKRIEGLLAKIEALKTENVAVKNELTQQRISEKLAVIARELNVPENIIADKDIMRVVVGQFVLTKDGDVVSAGKDAIPAKDALAAMQKQKPHWQPPSQGGSGAEDKKTVSHSGEWFTKQTF